MTEIEVMEEIEIEIMDEIGIGTDQEIDAVTIVAEGDIVEVVDMAMIEDIDQEEGVEEEEEEEEAVVVVVDFKNQNMSHRNFIKIY